MTVLLEKCDLCISTPLPHGISIVAVPGSQVGATWAEKSNPIGPEWPRSGKPERSEQSNLGGRRGLAVGAMGPTGTQPRTKSSRRAKSISATRYMIRSSIYIYIYIY